MTKMYENRRAYSYLMIIDKIIKDRIDKGVSLEG
jgi:hypothetical protein